MPTLSAIIITKNEEASVSRCLKSIRFADEIIVVDSGSTDRTVAVAREHGARVFVEEWKGYTQQKNSALEKANGEWVVSLDADEEFSAAAQEDIRRLIRENDPAMLACAFRRVVFYLGRWIRHGDWYPDYVVRLWRRRAGRFEGGRVHESVRVDGIVRQASGEILHYTYRDLQDQQERMERYSKLWAQDQFERGRLPTGVDLWLRPPARFLRGCFLKGGCMDGWRGWLIAWMCAKEVGMKYRALRDLQWAARAATTTTRTTTDF